MIDDQQQVIFVHLEKTGGTSIAYAMGKHRADRRIADSYDNGLAKHYSVAKAKAEYGASKWSRYYRFAVVRNPWDRYV